MEYVLKLLQIIFTGASAIAVVVAAVAFAVAQWRSTTTKENLQSKDDLIKTLKENAVAERDKADRLQTQINDLSREFGELKGQFEAAQKEKEAYLNILKDRNPEQIEFMKFMIDSAKQNTIAMGEIQTFMHNLNEDSKLLKEKAKKTEAFQKEVIKATAQETGKPLRKD